MGLWDAVKRLLKERQDERKSAAPAPSAPHLHEAQTIVRAVSGRSEVNGYYVRETDSHYILKVSSSDTVWLSKEGWFLVPPTDETVIGAGQTGRGVRNLSVLAALKQVQELQEGDRLLVATDFGVLKGRYVGRGSLVSEDSVEMLEGHHSLRVKSAEVKPDDIILAVEGRETGCLMDIHGALHRDWAAICPTSVVGLKVIL